jgi:hypothetical protein
MASADHWNRKLLMRNAASGVTFTRGSRGLRGAFRAVVDDPVGDDDDDCLARAPVSLPSELPDPSATIEL